MKKLALLCVAACLVLVIFGSLHAGKKMNLQYAAAPNDDAPELGPATSVCVWDFTEKNPERHKCAALKIGMDETTVASAIGVEHGTTTDTTANGTVSYWHYQGGMDEKDVLLMFVNGKLDAIQN